MGRFEYDASDEYVGMEPLDPENNTEVLIASAVPEAELPSPEQK
jgi:hypothetical protein